MWAMRDPDYLTATEAASRLGISLRTVRRRIADGSLPSARIGRAVRIPTAALDLPVARPGGSAARETVAPYATDADGDRAAYVARWNAAHWPDTFCLLYTSDAADDLLCVDLGGRRIIK